MDSKIDLKNLQTEIQQMQPHSPLFKLLKKELGKLGYWYKEEINLNLLRSQLLKIERWQPLYKVVKEALSSTEHWKEKPRGNPRLGYTKGMGKNKKG